ncbi:acyl-CoA dehydrogenase family protein [Solimonas terrae]|uniref:Acyl-CoA dehydrogenase n=1 Tax=Solimonas terrae TaxID=1396819 RepID=A0A6M2BU10_9GAMM|nr:acyl-CoA dehydrogenase family protein [Solimonas terrae]NGY05593.1 acyl-CoA dehydrogenase [Solimonas terrae]
MIPRALFQPEHEEFRRNVRRFMQEEVVPKHDTWEAQNQVDRAIWKRAGELGLLCITMPEEYGGGGADRLYSAVLIEEQSRAGASGLGFSLHTDIVSNYLNNFGSHEQKLEWLPRMATGEIVTAIAMSEPAVGTDLQNIKTRALDMGDHYLVNGSKTFITNGYLADMAIVAVKTDPPEADKGAHSISLLIVEANRKGFSKGAPLKKIGMKAQDTCELFFENVEVPKANLLGAAGKGFVALMKELPWERMIISIGSIAGAEAALENTMDYTRSRKVMGQSVASFQNSRFRLAEMNTEIGLGRVYVDRCLELLLKGQLSPEDAAAAKYWCSDLYCRVVDQCLQLHGGYGYMLEYPIARAYVDCRPTRIFGGSNEVMKELIARSMSI